MSIAKFDKYYLLDTNILLEDATNIIKLSDEGKNLIILAETVLDEIDSKKSGFEEINFQAREFARLLENSQIINSKKIDEYKIIKLKIEDKKEIIVDIISKEKYDINEKNISSNIINDRKILEIANFSNKYYEKSIEFISMDVMARIRAIGLDINSSSLLGKDKNIFDFEFIKSIEINFEDLENLDNQNIEKFDKEYKVENFSYCMKVKHSDQVVLANIQNRKIKLLNEEEIRNQVITPLNKEQLFFSNAIINHFYNVLIVEAKAGSGKTLLALSGALKLVKQKYVKQKKLKGIPFIAHCIFNFLTFNIQHINISNVRFISFSV